MQSSSDQNPDNENVGSVQAPVGARVLTPEQKRLAGATMTANDTVANDNLPRDEFEEAA